MDPLIGSIVLDRYEVVRRIGSGGMGAVYIGKQKAVGRDVALKILRSDLMSNEHVKERFRREAEIIGKLRHPNTIQLIDYGETAEGLAIMVMELLVGQPLNERLKEKGPLPLLAAMTVGMEIASSLAEAHLLGMVHRDLKPANIFLVEVAGQTHAKVLDFGIARILDEEATRLTSTGQVFGTPRYMSPEQALSTGEVDSRSDIYALGLIMYECIVGVPPFVAQTSIQYLSAHTTATPPKLREHFAEAPEVLEQLIDSCLAKSAEERPQTAEEVVKHLEQIRRMIESGADVQPLPIRFPSARIEGTAKTEQGKSVATEPASMVGAKTSPDFVDQTLIKPKRDEAPPPGSKPPLLLFGGIGLIVLAALILGVVWLRQKDDVVITASDDAGVERLAVAVYPDAMAMIESPPRIEPDSGVAQVEEHADAAVVALVADDPRDAGVGTVEADPGQKTKSKTKSKTKNTKQTKQSKGIVSERGEGVITGPASLTLEGGEEESLVDVAKKCSSSVLKGRAKLTLKKCPAGCAVIVEGKCGGKTPVTDVSLANGLQSVAVVCGNKIVMETRQAFRPEETTELSCR